MDYTKKRRLIPVACCVANLCIGWVYAWSVFAGPFAARLSTHLGQTLIANDLSIVFTMVTAVVPFAMISGGAINDKLGARWEDKAQIGSGIAKLTILCLKRFSA